MNTPFQNMHDENMRFTKDLMNDSTYQCKSCDEVIKSYTTSGETNFCPVCGSRDLKGYDEE